MALRALQLRAHEDLAHRVGHMIDRHLRQPEGGGWILVLRSLGGEDFTHQGVVRLVCLKLLAEPENEGLALQATRIRVSG